MQEVQGPIPGLGSSPGEGNGKSTPVSLPGKSHGQSLAGYIQFMRSKRVGRESVNERA